MIKAVLAVSAPVGNTCNAKRYPRISIARSDLIDTILLNIQELLYLSLRTMRMSSPIEMPLRSSSKILSSVSTHSPHKVTTSYINEGRTATTPSASLTKKSPGFIQRSLINVSHLSIDHDSLGTEVLGPSEHETTPTCRGQALGLLYKYYHTLDIVIHKVFILLGCRLVACLNHFHSDSWAKDTYMRVWRIHADAIKKVTVCVL
jgi:hypothetical protein